jgi:hypothetical protein
MHREAVAVAGSAAALAQYLVDLRREVKVFLSQTTGVVGGQCKRDLAPANVDIGVVPSCLGEKANLGDKRDRAREGGKLEGFMNRIPFASPVGEVVYPRCDLRFISFAVIIISLSSSIIGAGGSR